jgi:hypothetical protein
VRRISVTQPDRRRGIPFTRLAAPGLLISLLFLAAGCIRPTENEGTSTPGVPPVSTIPTVFVPPATTPTTPVPPTNADPAAIQAFLQSYGAQIAANSFNVWHISPWQPDINRPSDYFVSATFTNPSNFPCIGVGIGTRDVAGNLVLFNGGYHCANNPAAASVAGQWLVTDSQGRPILIFAGRVLAPNVANVQLVFPSGPGGPFPPTNGTFISNILTLDFATQLNLLDANGAVIASEAIPVSPQG